MSDRLDQTLKEFIIPKFRKNFYRLSKKPMLRYLGMETDEVPGKGTGATTPRVQRIEAVDSAFKFQVEHNTHAFGGGTYAQKIGANLRPGTYYGQRSNAKVKFITQSMEIPIQVIQASRKPEFSMVDEIVQNMDGAMHTMQMEQNRMFFAPTTHELCRVDGTSTGTTITVGNANTPTNETWPVKHLQKGDVLWIGTAAEIEGNPMTAETVTVSEVASSTTFTATTAESVTDNDLVVRADVYDLTDSVYTDWTSCRSLVNNTGTVQGINKATNFWFQSYVPSDVGALALADFSDMANTTREYSDDPSACFWIGNQKQWDRYSALLTSTKSYDADRFQGNLAGGVKGLTVYTPDGALPFYIDNDVEDGVIYLIDPNGLAFCSFREFGPADDGLNLGGYPSQRKSGTLNYEFALWVGGDLAQTNARSSGVLKGITS